MKYPHIILGAIAASAPILAFPSADGGEEAAGGGEDYWAVVTRDASPEAGAAGECIPAFRAAWPRIESMGNTVDGRALLSSLFNMCSPIGDPVDVEFLMLYIAMAVDTMAMGNFPYASNYLTGGAGDLPAWPVRVACDEFVGVDVADTPALLVAVREAAAVFYNATGTLKCHELPADKTYDGIWDYQWCTELLCQVIFVYMYIHIIEYMYPHTHIHVVLIHQVAARGISALSPQSYFSRSLFYSVVFTHTHTHQESYFRRDGVRDMFYPFSMSPAEVDTHCYWKYGVWPRRSWITQLYGECVPENECECECMRGV